MSPYTWKAVIPLPANYIHPQGFTYTGDHWALIVNGRMVAIDPDRDFLESLL